MAEQKINEKLILIIGKATIAKGLPFGKDLDIKLKGSLLKTELIDNQDGTFDKLFKVKVITAECEEQGA